MSEPNASTAALAVSLLGYPRFAVRGTPFAFKAPPRTIPLLGILLLNRGAYLMRDAVAFMLWPDDTEQAARTNLRRHLNYLKSALPASATPWFVADAESVIWSDANAIWFDVDAFRSHVDRVDTMAGAVDLYAGDLLTGFDDDWLIAARDRLRSHYIGALQRLLIAARRDREHARAAAYARRILAEDAWREDALRHLVAVRYESGDRSGALRDCGAFVRRLHDEGIEPMPETIALRDAVIRGAALPEHADRSDDDETPGAGATSTPFVGREPQLAQLTTALSRATRGRGSFVLVGGKAGSGKSRLVSELALVAIAQGARVLRGGTPHLEPRPYAAIASALRTAGPILAGIDLRPGWSRALRALVPELEAHAAPSDPTPPSDAPPVEPQLFDALFRSLNAIARVRPTLVILEDLHRADGATLAAIEYLARRVGMQSLLIVGTCRTEALGFGTDLAAFRRRLGAEDLLSSVFLARRLADAEPLRSIV